MRRRLQRLRRLLALCAWSALLLRGGGARAVRAAVVRPAPAITFVSDIGRAGTVCNAGRAGAAGVCRSFVHVVMAVAVPPAPALGTPVGTAALLFDGRGPPVRGTPLTSEAHLVDGICTGQEHHNCTALPSPSLMVNVGWETWSSTVDRAPASVCVAPTLWPVAPPAPAGGPASPVKCLSFDPPVVANNSRVAGLVVVPNAFSSSAIRHCAANHSNGGAGAVWCRTTLHVVFKAASSDPVEQLSFNGRYSVDGNATWSSDYGRAFYEQHIDQDPSDGIFYQSAQFDVEFPATSLGPPTRTNQTEQEEQICYEVRVSSPTTGATARLTGCLAVCEKLQRFHDPAGYCPS